MMKATKRLAAFMLTALMLCALVVPAFADDYVPGSKPVSEVPEDRKTALIYIYEPIGEEVYHTYDVYQIFVGEAPKDENGNPVTDENGNLVLTNLTKGFSLTDNSSLIPDEMMQIFNDPTKSLAEKVNEIDRYIAFRRSDTDWGYVYATMTNSSAGATLNVEPGYYLLVDTSLKAQNDSYLTGYPIFGMAVDQTEEGTLTYEPKAKIPSFKKEVRDNDKDYWEHQADFSYTHPGATGLTPNLDGFENPNVTLNAPHADTVAFRLTATLGDNYDMYDKYQLIFHDMLPALNGPLFRLIADAAEDWDNVLYRVEVVGEDGTSKFDTFSLNDNNGIQYGNFKFYRPKNTNELEVIINDIKTAFKDVNGNYVNLKANDEIRITYYAYTDNHDFPVGDDATLAELKKGVEDSEEPWLAAFYNPAANKAYLEYSNNPFSDQLGETLPDHATVYTYGLMLMKEGSNQKPLTGAEFKLSKKVGNNWVAMSDEFYPTYGEYNLGQSQFCNAWFWDKLDSGEYLLEETKAPDGYQLLDKTVLFKVNRDVNADGTCTVTLTQSDIDKNELVTVDRTTQKVYSFIYYPLYYADDFDTEESIFIKENSDFFNATGSFTGFFTDSDGNAASLRDLVECTTEYLIDDDGGAWIFPGAEPDYYYGPFEYQLYTITVRNGQIEKNITLPSAGGIGTTVFYVVGGLMVVVAVVLLVTRRRMKDKE